MELKFKTKLEKVEGNTFTTKVEVEIPEGFRLVTTEDISKLDVFAVHLFDGELGLGYMYMYEVRSTYPRFVVEQLNETTIAILDRWGEDYPAVDRTSKCVYSWEFSSDSYKVGLLSVECSKLNNIVRSTESKKPTAQTTSRFGTSNPRFKVVSEFIRDELKDAFIGNFGTNISTDLVNSLNKINDSAIEDFKQLNNLV